MKYIVTMVFAAMITPISGADGDYIPLERVSCDDEIEKEERAAKSVADMYKHGVRAVNQALDFSKRELTTVSDLAQYRKSLSLRTLTVLNIHKNYIQSDDCFTILREIPTLTFLNVGNNRITTLAELPVHEKLETFLVHNNHIKMLDVGDLMTKLLGLRQGAFQNNPLQSNAITNINGLHTHVEELWFDHTMLTSEMISKFITACPNLTSELIPGSRKVQGYYSQIKNKYDTFGCCNWCDDCCCDDCSCLSNAASVLVFLPIIGALIGLGVAGITMEVQNPQDNSIPYYLDAYKVQTEHRAQVLGFYSSFCVPLGAVLVPLSTRLLHRLYCYCITKPEDRYETVYTRAISAQPQLLDLIDDVVDPTPSQEDAE